MEERKGEESNPISDEKSRTALKIIAKECGKICFEYDFFNKKISNSAFTAWKTAVKTLKGEEL